MEGSCEHGNESSGLVSLPQNMNHYLLLVLLSFLDFVQLRVES
jgi:hypothetical protein